MSYSLTKKSDLARVWVLCALMASPVVSGCDGDDPVDEDYIVGPSQSALVETPANVAALGNGVAEAQELFARADRAVLAGAPLVEAGNRVAYTASDAHARWAVGSAFAEADWLSRGVFDEATAVINHLAGPDPENGWDDAVGCI
ncbi:MAG: hypothetical protein HYU43_01815, partial [Armatimonadetes bacterium]|nr:hypothetical protein [Armatimonadota bacterium]